MAFEKAGKAWSAEEDRQLINEYKSGVKIDEICKIHMRNIGGISSRLIRLELIKDRKDRDKYIEDKWWQCIEKFGGSREKDA